LPAPSSFAKDRDKGCWVDFLRNHPDQIICHRNAAENSVIPVSLLSSVFAEVQKDLDLIQVTSTDCLFVVAITDWMCGAFFNEQERARKFIELFEIYVGWKLLARRYENSETDGSLHYRNRTIFCNLEVKVEKGSGGGDPCMKSIAILVLHWNCAELYFTSTV
jgi:hypothetical protein